MPSVICHRTRPQDCALLGHLYRSSPNAIGAQLVRPGRHTLHPFVDARGSRFGRRCLAKSPSPTRVSLPLLVILSPEVVLLILAELEGRDILRCRTICKLVKLFIDHSAQLRYIVEAHARGLEPLRHINSAQHHIEQLLARERSWAMFGSTPDMQMTLDPPTIDDGSDEVRPPANLILYDSGRMFACYGSHVTVWTLEPRAPSRQEYVVPGLNDAVGDSIIAFGDQIAFSTSNAVCVYSFAAQELVRILPVLRRGNLGAIRVRGDFLAASFCPERQSSGVMLWNWKTGRLIDTLHSAGAPTLSFAFLDGEEIALVRTNRTAGSAHIDIYGIKSSYTRLRSSLALPNADPTKWYSKADIHTNDANALPDYEHLQPGAGVVAISIRLRSRAPDGPPAIPHRVNSTILVIRKRALDYSSTISGSVSNPVPWPEWSSAQFRMLTGAQLAPSFHSSPVWGNHVILLGPERDKISLCDFCPIGVKAASAVWKAVGAGGVKSAFSGGGGGGIGGRVSVRAALAQRARTLVRASSLAMRSGWLEGMDETSESMAEQIPYVISIRRGMHGVSQAAVDGERVVVLKDPEDPDGMSIPRVISFVCSV